MLEFGRSLTLLPRSTGQISSLVLALHAVGANPRARVQESEGDVLIRPSFVSSGASRLDEAQ